MMRVVYAFSMHKAHKHTAHCIRPHIVTSSASLLLTRIYCMMASHSFVYIIYIHMIPPHVFGGTALMRCLFSESPPAVWYNVSGNLCAEVCVGFALSMLCKYHITSQSSGLTFVTCISKMIVRTFESYLKFGVSLCGQLFICVCVIREPQTNIHPLLLYVYTNRRSNA